MGNMYVGRPPNVAFTGASVNLQRRDVADRAGTNELAQPTQLARGPNRPNAEDMGGLPAGGVGGGGGKGGSGTLSPDRLGPGGARGEQPRPGLTRGPLERMNNIVPLRIRQNSGSPTRTEPPKQVEKTPSGCRVSIALDVQRSAKGVDEPVIVAMGSDFRNPRNRVEVTIAQGPSGPQMRDSAIGRVTVKAPVSPEALFATGTAKCGNPPNFAFTPPLPLNE